MNLAIAANCPLCFKISFTFLFFILIFLLVVCFSCPLYPSNSPPHFSFEKKSNLTQLWTSLKCKNPNKSLNSHWLSANVAGRLIVLPANINIHPHLAGGRVFISGPGLKAILFTKAYYLKGPTLYTIRDISQNVGHVSFSKLFT